MSIMHAIRSRNLVVINSDSIKELSKLPVNYPYPRPNYNPGSGMGHDLTYYRIDDIHRIIAACDSGFTTVDIQCINNVYSVKSSTHQKMSTGKVTNFLRITSLNNWIEKLISTIE